MLWHGLCFAPPRVSSLAEETMFDINAHLGVHAQALRLRATRSELIADNLANADTPDFKARDVDFRAALAATADAAKGVSLATTSAKHIGGGGAANGLEAAIRYREPLAPSLDGNTVDVQVEQAAFAENAVRYQATLTFLSSRLRGLMTAITGQ
jgi:flagellar basal-body rod protein FlgB